METDGQRDIWGCMDAVKVDMKLCDGAGRGERASFQNLQEGLQEGNLDKIYESIEAVERGIGVRADQKVRDLIKKAYDTDPVRLCHTIAGRENILEYLMFLSACCTAEMITFFTKMEGEPALFYYECARTLLKRRRGGEDCGEGILCGVKKVVELDLKLWKRWIAKSESDPEWQKLLGDILGELDEEALGAYGETITLEMSATQGLKRITEAFKAIPDTRQNHVIISIAGRLIPRWTEYMENKKAKGEFQFEIFASAYSDLIVWCLNYRLREDRVWAEFLRDRLSVLEADMYDWYETLSLMDSAFYLDMTPVYYALCSRRNELGELIDGKIRQQMHRIMQIAAVRRNFWKQNRQPEIMEEIESVFSGRPAGVTVRKPC